MSTACHVFVQFRFSEAIWNCKNLACHLTQIFDVVYLPYGNRKEPPQGYRSLDRHGAADSPSDFLVQTLSV